MGVKAVLAGSAAQAQGLSIERHSVLGAVELHWHDYYEIEIVYEGRGVNKTDVDTFVLERGSAYMLTPNNFHSVASNGGELKLYTINFSCDILPEALRSAIQIQQGVLCLAKPASSGFLEAVESLKQAYDSEGIFRAELINALFIHICVELLRGAECTVSGSTLIGRIMIYLKQHFAGNITKAGTAQHFNITSNYLGDMFKRETGQRFIFYLNNIRLHYAASLLMNSDLNINDVCYKSGFESPSYFIKLFNKKFGCTPKAYKKERGKVPG